MDHDNKTFMMFKSYYKSFESRWNTTANGERRKKAPKVVRQERE